MYRSSGDEFWQKDTAIYVYALEFVNGDVYTIERDWWDRLGNDWNVKGDLLTRPFEDISGRVYSPSQIRSCESLLVAKKKSYYKETGFWKNKHKLVREER
jgi:hypothetical protein